MMEELKQVIEQMVGQQREIQQTPLILEASIWISLDLKGKLF